MGYQATIIIHVDALNSISNDKNFGKKLSDAILKKANTGPQGEQTVRFNSRSQSAGAVIEVHHADEMVLVESGRNTGRVIKPKP